MFGFCGPTHANTTHTHTHAQKMQPKCFPLNTIGTLEALASGIQLQLKCNKIVPLQNRWATGGTCPQGCQNATKIFSPEHHWATGGTCTRDTDAAKKNNQMLSPEHHWATGCTRARMHTQNLLDCWPTNNTIFLSVEPPTTQSLLKHPLIAEPPPTQSS